MQRAAVGALGARRLRKGLLRIRVAGTSLPPHVPAVTLPQTRRPRPSAQIPIRDTSGRSVERPSAADRSPSERADASHESGHGLPPEPRSHRCRSCVRTCLTARVLRSRPGECLFPAGRARLSLPTDYNAPTSHLARHCRKYFPFPRERARSKCRDRALNSVVSFALSRGQSYGYDPGNRRRSACALNSPI